ncbi:MAG: sulfite exporter TauE/SafE family protein [Rhizobiaceae bacterium]
MDPQFLILAIGALVFAGVTGGLLAGMLGVGGGIIIVPIFYTVLTALGIEPARAIKVAVATSLATIIATSLASVRSHHRRSSVMWPLVRSWFVPIVLGVVAGTLVGGYVDGRLLTTVFAIVALVIAVRTVLVRSVPRDGAGFPNRFATWFFGGVVGLVSTLMGIGGGTLSVPILTTFGYDVRKAVGTASAIGFLIGVPGTLGYIVTGMAVPGRPPFSLGYVSIPSALALLPLTMLMAPVGARIAHAIKPRTLELWFALFLSVTAAKMIFDLLRSMR